MTAILSHTINTTIVQQRAEDGYIHATAMCKAAGKQFNNYSRLDTTQAYLQALASDTGIPVSRLINGLRGGNSAQGTWVHPKVAIHLAQWLSPEFAVQVSNWIFDWLSGKTASSSPLFSWKAEIEAANFDPKEPLPPEVQDAISERAWVLTRGVQQLLERHLTRRVTGSPRRAVAILESATLEEAIAPFHHQEVETVLTIMDAIINVALNARLEMCGLIQRKIRP